MIMLGEGNQGLVIGRYYHVVSVMANEIAELLDESGWIEVRTRNAPELANGARTRSGCVLKMCSINRNTVPMQRSRNCDDDSGNPTENKNRRFQKVPCFRVRRLSVRRMIGFWRYQSREQDIELYLADRDEGTVQTLIQNWAGSPDFSSTST